MTMQVLVTGANGFIGSILCKRLLSDGYRVRGSVRTNKGISILPKGVDVVTTDSVGSETNWSKALTGISTVVHLAARVHIMKDAATNPLSEFRNINVAGTERLANMAAQAGVKRFVFLSTVKVNGEQTRDRPFIETDSTYPDDPYAISKWEAEQELHVISKETGLEVVILRPPLVYGPGVKANFLRLLKLVDRNIPLPFLNINNRRSFIYIGNLVDAIVNCCTHPNARGETFLVSDGEDISTPELIKVIAQAMNKKAKLFPFPQSLLRMIGSLTGKREEIDRLFRSLCVDSSKIRKVLNWNPPFGMRDGINETVRWYMNR